MDGNNLGNQHQPDDSTVPPISGGNPIGVEHLTKQQPQQPIQPDPQLPVEPTASGIPVPSQPPADVQIPANPVMPQATGPTRIPVNDIPTAADDSDLIEKEWVHKAKYIVESTKNDPHLLNKEMNKMKADYIQKRYNKQLKVSED